SHSLSLPDALPISVQLQPAGPADRDDAAVAVAVLLPAADRPVGDQPAQPGGGLLAAEPVDAAAAADLGLFRRIHPVQTVGRAVDPQRVAVHDAGGLRRQRHGNTNT